MGSPGLSTTGFGAGLAQGFANVYSQKRADDTQRDAQREESRARMFMASLPTLLENATSYDDIQPALDQFMHGANGGKVKKPKAGETDPHEMLAQLLAPHFSAKAAAASGADPAVGGPQAIPPAASSSSVGVSGEMISGLPSADEVAAPPVPDAPATAPTAPARQSLLGVPMKTPDEQLDRKIHEQQAIADADTLHRTQKAREFYNQFKEIDPDFELRDALRMAGFNVDINRSTGANGGRGSDLAQALHRKAVELGKDVSELTTDEANLASAEFYASKRSMGVNREALARAEYGKAFGLLDPKQQATVIQKETSLLGQHSYATTAAGNQADYDAPITPVQSQQTELPVGTTGDQLAGQTLPSAQDRDALRSVLGVQTQLNNIKDHLLAVLPSDQDLVGGLLPGAVNATRRRLPEYRKQYAALESAVSGIVNTVARAAGQKGSQSEGDALRAEQAIVQLKDAILAGDTRESAAARIDQTLQMIEQVKAKLPQPPKPTAKGGGGGSAAAATAPEDPARRALARALLAQNVSPTTKKPLATDDAAVTLFLRNNPNFK